MPTKKVQQKRNLLGTNIQDPNAPYVDVTIGGKDEKQNVYTKDGKSFIADKNTAALGKNTINQAQSQAEADMAAQEKVRQAAVSQQVNATRTADLTAAVMGETKPATDTTAATQPTLETLQADFQNQSPLQKIGGLLTGSTLNAQANAAGTPIAASYPMIAGAGAVSAVANTGQVVKEAKTALSAVKSFKWAGVGLASAATTLYGFFSSKKADALTSDIKTLVKVNNKLALQVKAGADPVAIKALMNMNKEEIMNKATDLRQAKKISLSDRIMGLDAEGDIQLALVTVAGTNAIVNEYILTGNPAVLDKLGAYAVEEPTQ